MAMTERAGQWNVDRVVDAATSEMPMSSQKHIVLQSRRCFKWTDQIQLSMLVDSLLRWIVLDLQCTCGLSTRQNSFQVRQHI